jgi:putative Holliday junction resolvase
MSSASLDEVPVSNPVETMERLQRILGIDFGTTRIGLSLSDPLQILAQPYDTLKNDNQLIERLSEIVRREEVILIVVGMPLNLKGVKGKKALEVDLFVGRLKEHLRGEIIVWDERFTTVMAHQTLHQMGTKKRDRETNKGRVDAMAASILLQSYLDSRKRSLSC